MTQEYERRFLTVRRELIRREFSKLNDMQQQAVLTTEGPLLLLAGAGSGKTTVLIHRVANLLRFGRASDSREIPGWVTEPDVDAMEAALQKGEPMDARMEALCSLDPVNPWNVIAITFTNKAANELKSRLGAMLGPEAEDVWAMTFHSACCRILRREIERLGYDRSFTIYDTADSERVMKDVLKARNIDEKELSVRAVLTQISRAKDKMQFPPAFQQEAEASDDWRVTQTARCYEDYQARLKEANALDFDDIILLTVKLLQDYEEVREYYQRKFRYVLVDEYQDTNNLQYLLTSLLAGGYENLCVVGDDDQSIYRFRGATIANILNFESQYKGAKLIRLEQNYRSTKPILDAANAVIGHNRGRKGKTLWTKKQEGSVLTFHQARDENAEAEYVVSQIFAKMPPARFGDFAVLYRQNAQSNAVERAFKSNGVPYRIIGGLRFFDRAEVKDMLAYLWLINNRADDLRLLRIINNPPRGIGLKTLDVVQRIADSAQMPLYWVMADARNYPALEKSAAKLGNFVTLIEDCTKLLETLPLPEFYDALLERSGYAAMLHQKGDVESLTRLDNVRELRSSIVGYVENHPDDASLNGFLEEIALYTDIERYDASADAVVIMTMHSAKGLEFPHVFIVGAEDGIFPGIYAIGDNEELEEERRLCYVAMTRAKETLTITAARQRMLYGRTTVNRPSRFLREIPDRLLRGKPQPEPERMGNAYANDGYGQHTSYSMPKPSVHSFHGPMLDLVPGCIVRHKVFGRGMVIRVEKMGNDALWEIAFDEIGTKVMLARTASQNLTRE